LLQPGILRGVATLGRCVDDQDRLTGIFGELDVAALEPGEVERKGRAKAVMRLIAGA